MEYLLPITPQPALRARSDNGRSRPRTPEKYRNYQNRLIEAIKAAKVVPGDYAGIRITFYFPIKKSNKKKIKAGDIHRIKPDSDNLIKAVKDCLEKAETIKNDKQIAFEYPDKYWCGTKYGFIYFSLYTETQWREIYGSAPIIDELFDSL